MNNPIEIIKEHQFLNKSINALQEKTITAKNLLVLMASIPLLLSSAQYLYQSGYHDIFSFTMTAFSLLSVCLSIIVTAEILSDERSVIMSRKKFYNKKLSVKDLEKLTEISGKSFEDIINNKDNSKLINTLKKQLEALEQTLYTREYIQSLKDAISSNPEYEEHLPKLETLVQNYNRNLEETNDKFNHINRELSKANVTTFGLQKEEPLRILEQE